MARARPRDTLAGQHVTRRSSCEVRLLSLLEQDRRAHFGPTPPKLLDHGAPHPHLRMLGGRAQQRHDLVAPIWPSRNTLRTSASAGREEGASQSA